MTVTEIAKKLGIPGEAAARLADVPEAEPYLPRLCSGDYDGTAQSLYEALSPDEDGFKILSAMLKGTLIARREYRRRGIGEDVFLATMGCFSRFVAEHKESFGRYGFDRWWWTGRQLSLRLFRLGALEYELLSEEGRRVSVHIPSDADLGEASVDASLLWAENFLREFFPDHSGAPFVCSSWLLSPALGELLPESSRINRFRSRFRIESFDENSESYKLWVFKNGTLPVEELPENTTLQRNMKRFIKEGGKVGSAQGVLLR